jgi:hypothetical protein
MGSDWGEETTQNVSERGVSGADAAQVSELRAVVEKLWRNEYVSRSEYLRVMGKCDLLDGEQPSGTTRDDASAAPIRSSAEALDAAITVLENVKIEDPSGRMDTEDAANRVGLALSYLRMVGTHRAEALIEYARQRSVRPDVVEALDELKGLVKHRGTCDYLYTDAWIKKLVRDLADPANFERVTGRVPEELPEA